MIDLRSDTFTKPTPLMLEAMFKASVGDDVFSEDPTINALENKVAQLFGMESEQRLNFNDEYSCLPRLLYSHNFDV